MRFGNILVRQDKVRNNRNSESSLFCTLSNYLVVTENLGKITSFGKFKSEFFNCTIEKSPVYIVKVFVITV